MNSDPDLCEPPVKKERLEDDLDMVNYETPMHIDVPVAGDAEIDPLKPVDNHEIQPTGFVQFAQPIKNEAEIKEELPVETVKIESAVPKIESDFVLPGEILRTVESENSELLAGPDSVEIESALPKIESNFVLPGEISRTLESGNSGLLARGDSANYTAHVEEIYISSDEEVEEITIEPKKEEIFRESRKDCDFQLVVGADGPEIQQLQQAPKKQHDVSLLKTQLMSPRVDQPQVPAPAVSVRPPNHASQQATQLASALQGQKHSMSDSANSSSVSIIGQDNCTPNAPLGDQKRPGQTATEIPNYMKRMVQNQSKSQTPSSAATPSSQEPPNNLLPISEPMSVSMLLKTPFLSDAWTNQQKNTIIKLSRPKPVMELSPNILPGISAEPFYNEIPWLCASSSLKKFFCWPCLLFFYRSSLTELWSVPTAQAVFLGEFKESWKSHEASHVHQAAEKTLKIWRQNMAALPPPNPNKEQQLGNFRIIERVRKNRKLLSLLVQSVCYLKKERHDAQVEDYSECFDHIVQSNRELQGILSERQGDFSSKSSADFVFNYALLVEDAVAEFMKSKVWDEIKKARFITLFMEDLSTVVDRSTVAVIGHFVDQSGDIQERIVDFFEIGNDRSAEGIFTLFRSIVSKFGLRLKVAGYTYSGTLVRPSEIAAFNERVERLCPHAKCFHYQRHNLTRMLFGALSHLNQNCRNFFLTITEFQQFFNDRRIISTFQGFESESSQPYDFDCGFITTLKRCYSSVLKTFSRILEGPEDWDNRISSQAPIFMGFLREFNTRFMITLISQLNLATVHICGALQGKIDTAEWKRLIRRGVSNLMNIRSYGFKDIYVTALSPCLVKEPDAATSDFPADLVAVFNEVVEAAISFLHQRFDTVDFGYVDLETVAQRYYTRLNLRPDDTDKFRAQIQHLVNEPMIKDKPLAEALKNFYEHNLAAAAPEYATFLDFAMTIPSSNSSLHCPAVDRILKYQRHRSFKLPKDSIWMEKELLTDISRQKKLSEAVIDIFVTYQNTKEFSYPGGTPDTGK